MSKATSHKPIGKKLKQSVPIGKRLIVKDARGRKVMAFEPGDTVDQQLPPGHTTELVNTKPVTLPTPVDPFTRITPKIAIEALMELVGVTKAKLVAKVNEIKERGES